LKISDVTRRIRNETIARQYNVFETAQVAVYLQHCTVDEFKTAKSTRLRLKRSASLFADWQKLIPDLRENNPNTTALQI
jgi:hypothetical protein